MSRNQFYTGAIYYRAFEGMNPTIEPEEPIFDSRFEGGNLDCVIRVGPNQYDLFLRVDSNTRGHLFWFYFSVKGTKGTSIRLNICSLTKHDTLYHQGMKPYIQLPQQTEWAQIETPVDYSSQCLRYEFIDKKLRQKPFYRLSFEIQLDEDPSKVAYCPPYTYSDLKSLLTRIEANNNPYVTVGKLGNTLTGLTIPIVYVGNWNTSEEKQVVFITARVHPGESNSSWIAQAMLEYWCQHADAQFLRQRVLLIFVPMLNPDGVVLGNSRCGASGKDLNREFIRPNRFLHPEVWHLRQLVEQVQETHQIFVYLDLHGHSRRKNIFVYGPDYNVTQPEYYKTRVIPKLLSTMNPIFRFYSCDYSIGPSKAGTARAVMLKEMEIPFVYTVEASIGLLYKYQHRKVCPFTTAEWKDFGVQLGEACKHFFEGIEQYQLALKRRRQKKDFKGKNRLLEIMQQIQKSSDGKEGHSEASSDSNNKDEDLEGGKLQEFTRMISEVKQNYEKMSQDIDKKVRSVSYSTSRNPRRFKSTRHRMGTEQQSNLLNDCFRQTSLVRQQTPRKVASSSGRGKQQISMEWVNGYFDHRMIDLDKNLGPHSTYLSPVEEVNKMVKITFNFINEQSNRGGSERKVVRLASIKKSQQRSLRPQFHSKQRQTGFLFKQLSNNKRQANYPSSFYRIRCQQSIRSKKHKRYESNVLNVSRDTVQHDSRPISVNFTDLAMRTAFGPRRQQKVAHIERSPAF